MAHLLTCSECDRPFTASRTDALTCSRACRDRRSRASAKVRAERERNEIQRAAHVLAALASVAALTPED